MTAEELWYCSFRRSGGRNPRLEPPKCKRLSRRPHAEQWSAAIDIAIEFAVGRALYRNSSIAMTQERYWWFSGRWWLIPDRVERRIFALHHSAIMTVIRRGRGSSTPDQVGRLLRQWRNSGAWRKKAAQIAPVSNLKKKRRT